MRLALRPAALLLSLTLCGCSAPYFATVARDFGTVLASPAADMGPLFRGIGNLCRRQADLAYLRSRLEDPGDQHLVPWAERLRSTFSGRKESIERRCGELEQEVALYQEMHGALVAYGGALRSLADTERADFRDSFLLMGVSLGRLSVKVLPQEPELGQIMREGSDAVSRLLRMLESARTERDIKLAIRTAALPVRRILSRLDKVKDVYAEQVRGYRQATQLLLTRIERATTARGGGGDPAKHMVEVLAFYELALRYDDELRRLDSSSEAFLATLGNLRRAHDKMVEAANNRIPPKEAFRAVRQIFYQLSLQLSGIADQLDSLYRRGVL